MKPFTRDERRKNFFVIEQTHEVKKPVLRRFAELCRVLKKTPTKEKKYFQLKDNGHCWVDLIAARPLKFDHAIVAIKELKREDLTIRMLSKSGNTITVV